jgi:hypothetical protein
MHILAIFLAIFLLGLGVVFFFFALWGAWMLYRYLQQRKKERAHRLATYLRRLRPVVAELLKQVNELDQASKYSGLDRDAVWSKKYQEALHKLLDANNKLEETNVCLVEQELASAQDSLLFVIRTIHVVSYRLKEMEPIEEIVELKAELKREQQKSAHSPPEEKKHPQETGAADASYSQTNSPSKGPAQSAKTSQTNHPAIEQKADGHSVLKVPEKKKEIVIDEKRKPKT